MTPICGARPSVLLLGGFPKRTYRLLGEAFKLRIVHGDVVGLALPSIAPTPCWRSGSLEQKVVGRCARWLGQSLELQAPS